MKEILAKANVLGLMIRDTDACRNFKDAEKEVAADSDASLLLKKYNELAETIRQRQEAGYELEQYETDRFRELTASVSSNPQLKKYLDARNAYIDMLMSVYREINKDGRGVM